MTNDTYRTFKINDVGGVLVSRAVVQGAASGQCALPGGANSDKCLGFTQEAQATQNKSVTVKRDGITFAVAAGAMSAGDWVNIADATGKVASCQAAVDSAPGGATDTHVVGRVINCPAAVADGDVVEIEIRIWTSKLFAS